MWAVGSSAVVDTESEEREEHWKYSCGGGSHIGKEGGRLENMGRIDTLCQMTGSAHYRRVMSQ